MVKKKGVKRYFPEKSDEDLFRTFAAIDIIQYLAANKRVTITDLVRYTGLARINVYKYVEELKFRGYVKSAKEGRDVVLSVTKKNTPTISQLLSPSLEELNRNADFLEVLNSAGKKGLTVDWLIDHYGAQNFHHLYESYRRLGLIQSLVSISDTGKAVMDELATAKKNFLNNIRKQSGE